MCVLHLSMIINIAICKILFDLFSFFLLVQCIHLVFNRPFSRDTFSNKIVWMCHFFFVKKSDRKKTSTCHKILYITYYYCFLMWGLCVCDDGGRMRSQEFNCIQKYFAVFLFCFWFCVIYANKIIYIIFFILSIIRKYMLLVFL